MVRMTEVDVPKSLEISDYVFRGNHWYLYRGGRKRFQRELQAERVAQLQLTETRSVAELWRKFHSTAKPRGVICLEQAVWLTLCIEWNGEAMINFNYDDNTVKCSLLGMELIL